MGVAEISQRDFDSMAQQCDAEEKQESMETSSLVRFLVSEENEE